MTRPLLAATYLAACLHGPLVAAGLYRFSYDAATHEFFASHYARSPFGLADPRWFGGFSVASYPPLVHQLIAVLATLVGYQAAFGVLLFLALLAFPSAVYAFARIFVAERAAGLAGVVAVLLPAAALGGDAFGQLPTLVALVLALLLAAEWSRYLERGERGALALTVILAGLTATAHHATIVLLVPPLLLATLAARLVRPGRRAVIGRAGVAAGAAALTASLALWPLLSWARTAPANAFIPHLSRESFLSDPVAQALFFWAPYGVLPGLALVGLARGGVGARICAALALVLGVIGLGGTTGVPALLFGPAWRWLTYDRFALWAAVTLLPLAAIALDAALAARTRLGGAASLVALALLAVYASVDSALPLVGGVAYERDVAAVAAFLNADGRAAWRYQTFGFGETGVRVGYLANADTMDGSYFTARGVPELATSGIGMLDEALWWQPSGTTLERMLAAADRYGVRWAFVADPAYDPYLAAAGYRMRTTIGDGIEVWDRPDVPPLAPEARRFGDVDPLGVLWGVVPGTLLTAALGIALARRRVALMAGWRRIARWGGPPSVWGRSLSR